MPYDITCTWNLKYATNEAIYKTETDSDIENRGCQGEGRVGEEWSGSLELADTIIYRMDKQHGPII